MTGYEDEPMEEIKTSKSYWSNCGMVFFTGGYGWGVTETGSTISLGKGEDIKAFLEAGELNPDLLPIQRKTLMGIKRYREEEGYGTGEIRMGRSGDDGTVRGYKKAVRCTPARKRAPVRLSKSKG